jgi:hypothetical protein
MHLPIDNKGYMIERAALEEENKLVQIKAS